MMFDAITSDMCSAFLCVAKDLKRDLNAGLIPTTCIETNQYYPKIQPDTFKLIEERNKTPRDIPTYQTRNKSIHKEIRKNIKTYNTKIIEKPEDNANMRNIARNIQNFYTNLYTSSRSDPKNARAAICTEDISKISIKKK